MPLVSDQLRYLVEDHADELAYRIVGVEDLTFAQWEHRTNRLAHALVGNGLPKHGRVALAFEAQDAAFHLVGYMATHKAGGATVPVNVRLSDRELTHVLAHSSPTVVLCSDELAPRIARCAPPSVQAIVTTGSAAGATAWTDYVSDDDSDIQVPLADDDIADILYTSGTTGLPKGVVARHDRATQVPVGKPHTFGGNQYLHASPLFTFAGVSFTTVPPALGMSGVYLPKFDAATWLAYVEEHPVTMTFLVPAMVQLLVDHPDWGTRDLSSLFLVSIGSAPISADALAKVQAAIPNATVSNSYSMTELGAAFTVMPPGEIERRRGSVGQVVPPLEVKIVDEDGNDAPADQIGEILVRKPGKQREYFDNDDANDEAWTDEGWLRSGDLGRLDADGFLYIVGRKKDVIIRGGNNVHAVDVEHVLLEHDGIAEAAVVGVPHEVLGEDIAAYLVRSPAGADLSEDDVKAFCAQHLADYKRPRQVHFVDELPRNAMGKVLKRELRPPA